MIRNARRVDAASLELSWPINMASKVLTRLTSSHESPLTALHSDLLMSLPFTITTVPLHYFMFTIGTAMLHCVLLQRYLWVI